MHCTLVEVTILKSSLDKIFAHFETHNNRSNQMYSDKLKKSNADT